MKYFFTTKVKVVLIIAVLLAAGLAILGNLVGKTPVDTLVQEILTPLRAGVSSLTDQAERFYNYMFRYEALEAENEALRDKIAQMEEDARLADTVTRENERLRELLKLQAAEDSFALVDAYIISRNPVDWMSSFTINRGTNAGIAVGMCAITSNKEVVGLVVETGTNYAVIKSVLDPSLQISATIAASGYSGMVQGAYEETLDGLLRMDYLPSAAVIRNKDQVITAGSTVYPRGLIVGNVVDAGYDSTGIQKFAILEPAADIDSLEQIFILTAFSQE